MRKLSVLALCTAFVLSFVGCADEAAGNRSDPTEREITMTSEFAIVQNDKTPEISENTENAVSVVSEDTANYPDEPREPGYNTFSGYLRDAGRAEKGYDGEAFINSEAADKIFRGLYYYTVYGLSKQDDLAVYEHWKTLGLEKKIYDIDDPDRMWSVFVPTDEGFGALDKLPVVFCLHGNDNNILLAETYGFAELGGREGFITVVPRAKNEDIIVDEIPRILDILKEESYPVDESRIYAAGFSKGGMATQTVALKYSDIFAAVAPGGCAPFGISADAAPITSGSLNWSFQA